jgi:aminotransferase in exopolysaccharide biosynthesis
MSKQNNLSAAVVAAIRSVRGPGDVMLHEPSFNGNEWIYIKECLDTTFVSSVGKFVDRFEIDLARFTGAQHAVAVVNGTAALHIALKLVGVKNEDEVLIPALTFVATANAVTYCNATPHFIDSEINTLGVDAGKLRDYLKSNTEQHAGLCVNRKTGQVIRALVPMHTFGHPVDLDGLLALSHDFNIPIVEDAAESLGSTYHGKSTGTFGMLGTLSFNGNKIITTGGGGAILTNNVELARRAKHLTTTAKVPHPWEFRHDEAGYNYRLPNLNAALGCAQLEQLPAKIAYKRDLFLRYQAAFADIEGLKLMVEPQHSRSNYWLQTILLDAENANLRDLIIKDTNENGLMTRPAWTLMPELLPYKACPCMDLTMAKTLAQRLINIPSSTN